MSHRFFSCVAALLFACFISSNAVGQQTAVIVNGRPMTMSSSAVQVLPAQISGGTISSATPTADGQPAAEGAEPEKPFAERRVEQLLAAKLDRTLPAVLKAWSDKSPAENESVAKTKNDDSATATVANIYDGLVVLVFESDAKFKVGELISVSSKDSIVGDVKILTVDGKKVSGQFQSKKKQTLKPAEPIQPQAEVPAEEATAEAEAEANVKEKAEAKPEGDVESETESESDTEAKSEIETETETDEEAEVTKASEDDSPTESASTTAAAWDALQSDSVVTVSKPENGQAKKAAEDAQIKQEVAAFGKYVTLGQWEQIGTYLKTLEPENADKVYAHLLSGLAQVPGAKQNQNSRGGAKPITNFLTPDDILAITEAAPKPITISVTGNKKFAGLADPISGKWTGSATIAGAPGDITLAFEFKLSGSAVTGNVSVSVGGETQGPFEIAGGNFNTSSGKLTFSLTADRSTAVADMQVADGKMMGSLSDADSGEMMRVEATLVEPAASAGEAKPALATATAATSLPPGINLPPGMSLNDLPPEAIAQLQAMNPDAATGASKPATTNKSHVPAIARLIQNSRTAGFDFGKFVSAIQAGTTHFGGDDADKKLIAADLLMKAGMTDDAEPFLPTLENSIEAAEIVPLKMWSQLSLKKYRQKRAAQWLDKAWQANQSLVAIDDLADSEKDAAMVNLIELSPQIDSEIGEKWLSESFTKSPQRGMTVLTNLGTKSSNMASQPATNAESDRLKILRLQNGAVENLLEVSPELADQWSEALTLLANTWLIEAATTVQYTNSNSSRGYRQYDMYGNSYWANENPYRNQYGRDQPRPIKIGDMLEIAPSPQWQQRIEPTLQTQLQKLFASLHMRINEEDKAFPYIEQIAATNPDIAQSLAEEFLRIWTRNHDPNTDRRERNPYIYFYGFDQKAEAIPLTRSKQERNLEELQGWVDRIRAMKLEKLDESLLANAFTTCHSSAEVYDIDRVKSVFGELENLKPETVAAICQRMRTNLSSNWREIRNQEEKQTKRRAPEVQQEVIRGYEVAQELVTETLKSSPDDWKLHLALAALMFEENAYNQTLAKSSEFTDKRDAAFEQFNIAAAKYGKAAPTLEEDQQSTEPFDMWFYASLGACDLGKVTNKTQPDPKQYEKIRDAINQLPGTLGESHMAKFANNLFTRMSPIKPEIKFRYLRAGFVIVEDHPRAWEARNLFGYYKDLVSELKLSTVIDGSDVIGHDEPFGVYVNLLHTKEIERESGGFGKYVQNQNNMAYSFNYGRPTENYRDKFSDQVKQALGEHFEVQSVTFVSPEAMDSVPADREGWRSTPYAYLLLKPRGSEVDRIAPLQLDMDFMDTSGYVVIPIESPALVVDATPAKGEARPISDLKVTQTLDERQAEEGRLIVEISATAKGLVPPLEDILNVERDRFEVVSIDDQGVLASQFDKESSDIQILSERSWTVEYAAKESQTELAEFSFGDAKAEAAELKFQRYEDADLVDVEQNVTLERTYAKAGWGFLYWLLPTIAAVLALIAGLIFVLGKPKVEPQAKFQMPAEVNPFTVLTLLKDIRQRNGISSEQTIELENSIAEVERHYFAKRDADEETDLETIASGWLQKAR